MHEVTGPDRARRRPPRSVAVVNDLEQLATLAEQRGALPRYVLLSHDNDGVTKFGVDLLDDGPRWLGPDRPTVEPVRRREPARHPGGPALAADDVVLPDPGRHEERADARAPTGRGGTTTGPTCPASSARSTACRRPRSSSTGSRRRSGCARPSRERLFAGPVPDPPWRVWRVWTPDRVSRRDGPASSSISDHGRSPRSSTARSSAWRSPSRSSTTLRRPGVMAVWLLGTARRRRARRGLQRGRRLGDQHPDARSSAGDLTPHSSTPLAVGFGHRLPGGLLRTRRGWGLEMDTAFRSRSGPASG